LVAAGSLAAIVGFVLYSRISSIREAMQSAERRSVLKSVEESPGIRLADLARSIGATRNAALHHVRVLEKLRLVRVVSSNHRVAVYPISGLNEIPKRIHTPVQEELIRVISNTTNLKGREIRKIMAKWPTRTVYYSLQSLEAQGVIEKSSATIRGATWRLTIAERSHSCMDVPSQVFSSQRPTL
jgi:predicted transcriptional regulator